MRLPRAMVCRIWGTQVVAATSLLPAMHWVEGHEQVDSLFTTTPLNPTPSEIGIVHCKCIVHGGP